MLWLSLNSQHHESVSSSRRLAPRGFSAKLNSQGYQRSWEESGHGISREEKANQWLRIAKVSEITVDRNGHSTGIPRPHGDRSKSVSIRFTLGMTQFYFCLNDWSWKRHQEMSLIGQSWGSYLPPTILSYLQSQLSTWPQLMCPFCVVISWVIWALVGQLETCAFAVESFINQYRKVPVWERADRENRTPQ